MNGHPSREAQLKALIRRRYVARISDPDFATDGRLKALEAGYCSDKLSAVPSTIASGWSGCGALAPGIRTQSSEIVVELGCGTGTDSWLIANAANPPQAMIAVDLTPEALKALHNAARSVEGCVIRPVAGDMECLPIADESCDTVIANGAFSLAIDQRKAYSESLRILRPGGRLHVLDLVWDGDLSADILTDPMGYGTSLGGVTPEQKLRATIEEAGFIELHIGNHRPFPPATAVEIQARKPQ